MDKLKELLQSRKFWALVLALAGIWTSYFTSGITIAEAVNASVGALAAYMIGTGIENSGQGVITTVAKTTQNPPSASGQATTVTKTVTEKTPEHP